jgi:site-specific DNA-methyltransferase (adenine-specific)
MKTKRRPVSVDHVSVRRGDCLAVLKTLADSSVDSVVTDPPAGIAFMGKTWDRDRGGRAPWVAWMTEVAAECLRVLKPGGHALVWSLPRTSHWTATAWEDAGFKIRDRISHIFGSGFPKSLDVGKAIDKLKGAKRKRIRDIRSGVVSATYAQDAWSKANKGTVLDSRPLTPAAAAWSGFGTALKPAVEDWWLLRKPLSEKSVAANVLRWGTGGLNIDACRVPGPNPSIDRRESAAKNGKVAPDMHSANRVKRGLPPFQRDLEQYVNGHAGERLGRFPAHLIHDGSEEVLEVFPVTTSGGGNGARSECPNVCMSGKNYARVTTDGQPPSNGSAARFFYCAKATRRDREEGCDGMPESIYNTSVQRAGQTLGEENANGRGSHTRPYARNHHPTVKSTPLMRYLCRLVTPPGGLVLDPFCGSGSTGKAAVLEGFRFLGIEEDPEYCRIARRRIAYAAKT